MHHGKKYGSKLETSGELNKKGEEELGGKKCWSQKWLAGLGKLFVMQLAYLELQRKVLAGEKGAL